MSYEFTPDDIHYDHTDPPELAEPRTRRKRIYISEDLTLPTPEIPHRGWHDIFEDQLESTNHE